MFVWLSIINHWCMITQYPNSNSKCWSHMFSFQILNSRDHKFLSYYIIKIPKHHNFSSYYTITMCTLHALTYCMGGWNKRSESSIQHWNMAWDRGIRQVSTVRGTVGSCFEGVTLAYLVTQVKMHNWAHPVCAGKAAASVVLGSQYTPLASSAPWSTAQAQWVSSGCHVAQGWRLSWQPIIFSASSHVHSSHVHSHMLHHVVSHLTGHMTHHVIHHMISRHNIGHGLEGSRKVWNNDSELLLIHSSISHPMTSCAAAAGY